MITLILRKLIVFTLLCGCVAANGNISWLSTSSLRCPTEIIKRGSTATCIASVDYLDANSIVPEAELNVRHDACTHAARSSCSIVASVSSVSCSSELNTTLCEYTIPFTTPTLVSTGGVYTISLTRKSMSNPSNGLKYPEALIAQGTLTCGCVASNVFVGLVLLCFVAFSFCF